MYVDSIIIEILENLAYLNNPVVASMKDVIINNLPNKFECLIETNGKITFYNEGVEILRVRNFKDKLIII